MYIHVYIVCVCLHVCVPAHVEQLMGVSRLGNLDFSGTEGSNNEVMDKSLPEFLTELRVSLKTNQGKLSCIAIIR